MNTFYLVVSPSEWLSYGNCTLRAPVDSLVMIADIVEHPRHSNLRSFSFDYRNGRCVVNRPDMRAWFDSPSKDNLLYFSSPPVANVILFYSETTPVWYRRMSETNHALASQLGLLSEHFFCQVDMQPAEGFCKMHVEDALGIEGDCWMNPLILRVNLSDNQLAPHSTTGLAKRIETSKVIGLAPAFMLEAQKRIDSQQWFSRHLAKLREQPVVMDGLFLGPATRGQGQGANAFTVLDQLGGTYCIELPGTLEARFSWCPPREASDNLLWFARYWQRRWGGAWAESLPSRRAVAPEQVFERAPQFEVCSIDSQTTSPILQQLIEQLASGKAQRHPLSVVHQVVCRGLDLGDELWRWVRRDRISQCAQRQLLVNAVGLTDAIARRFLLPASPVRVCFATSIPFKGGYLGDQLQAESDYQSIANAWYVDPLDSFRCGGWEFLSRLVRCESPISGDVVADWSFGWWSQLYESLYETNLGARSNIRIPARGFAFRHCQLGCDSLKTTSPLYRQGKLIST